MKKLLALLLCLFISPLPSLWAETPASDQLVQAPKSFLTEALYRLHSFFFFAGGTCPTAATYSIQGVTGTLSALGVTSCYFVDYVNGSDSNTGTDEAHPFQHMLGQNGCTGNCSTASTSAGIGWIFKGGITVPAAGLGIQPTHAGTSSHPNYIGVDPAWFDASCAGGVWCRPILSGTPSGNAFYFFVNSGATAAWTTVDNFEETGWSCVTRGSGTMNGMISPDVEFENFYVHGWSYTQPNTSCQIYAFGANASNGTSQVINSWFHNNVVDGSDQSPAPSTASSISCGSTPGCVPVGCVLHADKFQNNVCNFTYNINGLFDQVSGNLIENMVTGNSGDHCNMTNFQGIFSGSTGYAYNNVYTANHCGGGLDLWLSGNTCSSSAKYYGFNNIFYNVDPGSNEKITTATHPAQGNPCGDFYVFNNTASATGGYLSGNGETPQHATVHLVNNHMIGGLTLCDSLGVTCTDLGNELSQTAAVANANTAPAFNQYNNSTNPVYAPQASTNSTVNAGQTASTALSFSCTGILAAACSDTTYATENTSNHTVSMRTVNARGLGGTWDIGAFEFTGQSTVVTPTCSPAAGTYTGSQTLTCTSATGGATLCYTTNGSTPAATTPGTCDGGSTTYSGPFSISTNTTVKILGTLASDTNSSVGSYAYTINANAPTCSPVAGTYNSTQSVTLSTTLGGVICYTTNGTTPATNGTSGCTTGTLYTVPVSIASTSTLKGIAGGTGNGDSSVTSCAYTINASSSGSVTMTGAHITATGNVSFTP
jgi:hypothetical protein